jgi:hypothetical protein
MSLTVRARIIIEHDFGEGEISGRMSIIMQAGVNDYVGAMPE